MPAPRRRPPTQRDYDYGNTLPKGHMAALEHARRLFPTDAIHSLCVVVDNMYDEAVARKASPEVLARLADASIDLVYALTKGEYNASLVAEGWQEIGFALRRADEGIKTLGDLIVHREEIHVVMAAAKKREIWGKR